ncbi:alpha/beta hydrolase [Corynebacterium sp. AOP40-9SA-29]|uniref:alpha/beta hydrolase n=1 Tax=Corynebacterium sp. AOP40-9SA-29 TaxID=3457677 RepID=UPI0040336BA3
MRPRNDLDHNTASLNPGNGRYRPGAVDKVVGLGARLLGTVASLVPRAAWRRVGVRRNDDGDVLDPDVTATLLALRVVSGLDIVDVPPVHSRRIVEREAFIAGGSPSVAEVREEQIAGVPVRVYLHRPADTSPRPTLVYLHGGGWVTGSLDSHDAACRSLCADGGVTVVAVDYRLAPEHPFPAALEDTTAVVAALQDGARVADTSVDAGRLVVAGDSAGGNLAASCCLWLRAQGRAQPALQQLFVPVTDLSQRSASYAEFGEEGLYLTAAQMEWYEHHYLGRSGDLTEAVDPRDPRVSPMLEPDLSGLAPAYVAVAGFDPLRDEGEAYAGRLEDAGVQVTLRRHRGLVHPFVNSVAVWSGARAAMAEATAHLRSALGTTLGAHG